MKKISCSIFIIFVSSILLFVGCSKKDEKLSVYRNDIKKSDSISNQEIDTNSIQFSKGLWISFNNKLEGNVSFEKYHGKNVVVKGRFNYGNGKGGYGHFNLWNGEIAEISEIEILKNQKRSKFIDVKELINNPLEYNGKTVKAYGKIRFGIENFSITPIDNIDISK